MAEQTQKQADAAAEGAAAPAESRSAAPAERRSARAEPEEPRRGALRALVALGSLAYAGALVIPAARFLTSPAPGGAGGKERWVRVGRLEDLPQGEPRRLQVVGDERDAFTLTRDQMLGSVWVLREGDKVRAMSATCPHLGCAIDLAADKRSFACPCHASRFGLSGDTEAGPSPRGMDPLSARVQDGWVEVDFRRFRQGITERKEAGA